MFQIVCDPSSGSIKLYLTEIRSGSLMFVVCLIGVLQRNFEPVVGVYVATFSDRRNVHTNLSEPLRISVKYSSVLPDDGSHTIRDMSE